MPKLPEDPTDLWHMHDPVPGAPDCGCGKGKTAKKEHPERCSCGRWRTPPKRRTDAARPCTCPEARRVTREPQLGDQWQSRWTDANGKQKTKSFPWNQRTQAKAHQKKMRAAVEAGTYSDPRDKGPTFAECAEVYFRRLKVRPAKGGDRTDGSVTKATKELYLLEYENWVKPALGKRPVKQLTQGELEDFLDDCPAGSRYVIKNVLANIVNHAIRKDGLVLPANPVAGIRLSKKRISTPVDLSTPQVIGLAAAMAKLFPRYEIAVWMAACAGYRSSEVCGARWSDLDALKRRVHIAEQRLGGEPADVKSKASDAVLPIDNFLIEKLAWHRENVRYVISEATRFRRKASGRNLPEEWDNLIIINHYGRPAQNDSITKAFNQAAALAGLPADANFRDLRRYYVAALAESGMSPKKVQRRARHARFETTMDIYAFPMEDELDEERGAFDKVFAPREDTTADTSVGVAS